MNIDSVMRMAPVIPVLTMEPGFDPGALAETLVEASLPVIECHISNVHARGLSVARAAERAAAALAERVGPRER